MAHILIVDDNRATAAYLKMVLNRHEHTVDRCEARRDRVCADSIPGIDMILVNLEADGSRGWDIFFELKGRHPRIPMLLFVVDALRSSSVRRIVSAVTEAVGGTNKLRPADRWRGPVQVHSRCIV